MGEAQDGSRSHCRATTASRTRQATVCAFVPETRAGAVLLDDGVRLDFDAAAFDGSLLRLLRPGQRVRLETVTHDSVTTVLRVQLLTLPEA